MILVIDNYDSFTYNLVQYLGELGGEIVVRRNDAFTLVDVEHLAPSQIVISPGPGTPDGAGACIELIHHFAGQVPILGVCLGHQAIAQAFGGRVVRAGELVHGKSSEISHDGKTIFTDIEKDFQGGRYHSLIVERATLPDCFDISAVTSDGLIMGMRHRTMKLEGVQFHPESILTPAGKTMLTNFLQL